MRSREREVQSEGPTAGRNDTSGPLVRPPIAYACSVTSGLALHAIWPLALSPSGVREGAAALLVAASIALFARSVREFRKLETPVPSTRPSTTVVRTGPYRFSRNPIYLAFTLLQLGIGLWTGNGWLIVLLIPTLALIFLGVVAREERYLTERFGEDYLRYRRSVRRWL